MQFVDLKEAHQESSMEIMRAISDVIETSDFTLGRVLQEFEDRFANYCNVTYGIGVSSGTDALYLALRASGVGSGDEVITVPNTFIATAEAISMCGAKPVFVDVDEDTKNMDPSLLPNAINVNTKAILPVHLYGMPAPMDDINRIASEFGLKVIEDACQAHGATYKGRSVGSLGDAAAFSFYPGKNLGGYGDGGMVTTDDPDIAANVRLLRDHGQQSKSQHVISGGCHRLHTIQAAILNVKLTNLPAWNRRRVELAKKYNELLNRNSQTVKIPDDGLFDDHVFHLYTVRVLERDKVKEFLWDKGIPSGVHYPIPLHLTDAYRELGYLPGDFPISEALAKETLSLPMHPHLRDDEVEIVSSSLIEAVKEVPSLRELGTVSV